MKKNLNDKVVMLDKDTSARIEVEDEQPCCENEDRNNWGGGCTNCGDPCL